MKAWHDDLAQILPAPDNLSLMRQSGVHRRVIAVSGDTGAATLTRGRSTRRLSKLLKIQSCSAIDHAEIDETMRQNLSGFMVCLNQQNKQGNQRKARSHVTFRGF